MTEEEILNAIDEIPSSKLEALIVAAQVLGTKSGKCISGDYEMDWYRSGENIVPLSLKKLK